MKQDHFRVHWLDSLGNPAGGVSSGKGFTISWQNGPLQRGEERLEPNGAFVETIIDAVIQRIQFYQDSKFNCIENEAALCHLMGALRWLEERTKNREERNVEGTHQE
jgi:hypothetical protein